MTRITNYGTLVSGASTRYGSGRTDMTALWPGFVQSAESEINRLLRTDEQTTSVVLTSASGVLTCPSDWKRIRSIRQTLVNKPCITVKDIERIERYLSEISETGDPELAAEVNGTIHLAPQPIDGVSFTVFYHRGVPALDSTNDADTNWLLDDHSDVYLYATLKEAAAYDHDDQAEATYQRLFASKISQLITSNRNDKYGERLVMQPNGGVA